MILFFLSNLQEPEVQVAAGETSQTPHNSATTSHNPLRAAASVSQKRKLEDSPHDSKKRRLIENKIDGYLTKTPPAVKEELDSTIAELFYACNIPFSVADHPRFLKAMSKLRPGYEAPNRKALGKQRANSIIY